MRQLTEQQIQILEALATYRYLTNDQIIRLGIVKQRSHLSTAFSRIRDIGKKLVETSSYGVHPQFGRIPDLHNLTKQGAELLIDEFEHLAENINYPKNRLKPAFRDYFHRVATIDTHISFRKSAISRGFEVDFFEHYFDKTGANRGSTQKLRAKTKIDLEASRYLIADGAGRYFDGEKKNLFLIEVHNGRDTKKLMQQLFNHLEAIGLGSPSLQYKHDRGHRVFIVFEHKGIMQATIKRLQNSPQFSEAKDYFLFKTLEQVRSESDFFSNWIDYSLNQQSIAGINTESNESLIVQEMEAIPEIQEAPPKEQPQAQEAPKEEKKKAQPSKKKKRWKLF